MSLLLHKVTVRFGYKTALDDFSFEFPSSGIIALLGENGAGKSTVLDVLSGFVAPTSGHVTQSSNKRSLNRKRLRNHCARLHQANVLPLTLTPADYLRVVLFPQQSRSVFGRVTANSFKELLPDFVTMMLETASIELDRPISFLSSGQQRALALAAVSIVQKPILLLDEPFSSLAEAVVSQASSLIRREAESRLVIFAEHDIPHALKISQRVLVLKAGRLRASLPAGVDHYSDLLQYFG